MAALYEDLFTQWLRARGTPPTVYQPAGFLGAPPVGWRLPVGRSAFVYRINADDPATLIVVIFEKKDLRRALRSPFIDFVKFLNLVKESGAGVCNIDGHVDVLSGRPADSVSAEKIRAFYTRHLAAFSVGMRNGLEWLRGDLTKYTPPLRGERRMR